MPHPACSRAVLAAAERPARVRIAAQWAIPGFGDASNDTKPAPGTEPDTPKPKSDHFLG